MTLVLLKSDCCVALQYLIKKNQVQNIRGKVKPCWKIQIQIVRGILQFKKKIRGKKTAVISW